jgi:hypothetical protein
MLDRYRNCSGEILSAEDINRTIELVQSLERSDDIRELMSIVTFNARAHVSEGNAAPGWQPHGARSRK